MASADTQKLMDEHVERARKFIEEDEKLRRRSPGIGLSYAVLTMQGLLAVIADLREQVAELESYLDRNGL